MILPGARSGSFDCLSVWVFSCSRITRSRASPGARSGKEQRSVIPGESYLLTFPFNLMALSQLAQDPQLKIEIFQFSHGCSVLDKVVFESVN